MYELPEQRFYVEYRGGNVFADEHNGNFFRVTVGILNAAWLAQIFRLI